MTREKMNVGAGLLSVARTRRFIQPRAQRHADIIAHPMGLLFPTPRRAAAEQPTRPMGVPQMRDQIPSGQLNVLVGRMVADERLEAGSINAQIEEYRLLARGGYARVEGTNRRMYHLYPKDITWMKKRATELYQRQTRAMARGRLVPRAVPTPAA